jgi:hypothetical protein
VSLFNRRPKLKIALEGQRECLLPADLEKPAPTQRSLNEETLPSYTRLADDRLKGSDSNDAVHWHRDGNCGFPHLFLKDRMTASLSNTAETFGLEDPAYLFAGENPELRHE